MHKFTIFSTIVLLLVGICLSADPPNWLGTFFIDNSCDQYECCCLSEQATITKESDTQLLVTANVSGVPCREQLNGSTTIAVLVPIPTDKSGFQITTNFLGTDNRFTLSSDNQYIANVNLQYPKCSAMGQRVNNNWLGTFLLDDSCVQAECCCLVEQVKISKTSDTQLLVSANVAGATCGTQIIGSTPVEIPIPIPQDQHGFQLTTYFVGSINRFTLTYDNQYIVNVNLQVPRCSGMARRVSST
jgi:hypothetical protein